MGWSVSGVTKTSRHDSFVYGFKLTPFEESLLFDIC